MINWYGEYTTTTDNDDNIPHTKCMVCDERFVLADYVLFCSKNCREDYFSAIGAGDTRKIESLANWATASGEASWWERGMAHP